MSNKRDQILTSFPGLEYLTRVSTAWNGYLLDQAGATQEVWDEVKGGNFEAKSVAKLWATGVESYYDVMAEAMRTNVDANRPIWVHVTYSRANPAAVLEHSVVLSRHQPDATNAEGTPFVNMDGGRAALVLVGAADVFASLKVSSGRKLFVKLDPQELANAVDGQYMSLVSVPNRGVEEPLAIIVLTVGP